MNSPSNDKPLHEILSLALLEIFAVIFLAGCATNPFVQSYENWADEWPKELQNQFLPSMGEPRIISCKNLFEDALHLEEQGLVSIGFAGFSAGLAAQQQLIAQAKKAGADAVLYGYEFSHLESKLRTFVSYQPGQTSYGTAKFSAYGYPTLYGDVVVTSPGTLSTHILPYQEKIFEQGAIFWRGMHPGILGARFESIANVLCDTERTNDEPIVAVVVINSPAFLANILPADRIIQISDQPITTAQQFTELLPTYAGQKVMIKVIRSGKTLDLQAHLNAK